MKKYYDSAEACLSWLDFLNNERGLAAIVGPITQKLEYTAMVYNSKSYQATYGAEAQLLGESGCDLSVEYPAHCFTNGNPLIHRALQKQGDLLHQYVRDLKQYVPGFIPYCDLYLETDTASGSSSVPSCFVKVAHNSDAAVITNLLKNQGYTCLQKPLEDLLKVIQDYGVVYILGFMNSRPQCPLRVTLIAKDDKYENLIEVVKILYKDKTPADFAEKLSQLIDLKVFHFALDIELLADGSLGDTIGLQFTTLEVEPRLQYRLISQEPYQNMLQLLQSWQIADERVNAVANCLWEGNVNSPNFEEQPYHLQSRISHFKLRWHKNKLLPGKVYLQMRAEPLEKSLNEVFNIY